MASPSRSPLYCVTAPILSQRMRMTLFMLLSPNTCSHVWAFRLAAGRGHFTSGNTQPAGKEICFSMFQNIDPVAEHKEDPAHVAIAEHVQPRVGMRGPSDHGKISIKNTLHASLFILGSARRARSWKACITPRADGSLAAAVSVSWKQDGRSAAAWGGEP